MENKNILLVFAVVIVVLFVVGGMVIYSQQKSIDRLNSLAASGNNSKALFNGAVATNPAAAVDVGRKKAMETGNYITGKITQISGNDLTVEADIPDWDKMKELASSQGSAVGFGKKPPTVKKTYSVSANSETQYIMNQLKDLRVGDGIWVTAREQVYQTDKITAAQIASPYNAPSSAAPAK